MGILEKIAKIQDELSKTQKNKATEYHIGLLKGSSLGTGRTVGHLQVVRQEDKVSKLPKLEMLVYWFPSVEVSFRSGLSKGQKCSTNLRR